MHVPPLSRTGDSGIIFCPLRGGGASQVRKEKKRNAKEGQLETLKDPHILLLGIRIGMSLRENMCA